MSAETILTVFGFLPGPLWVWDTDHGKPQEPVRPRHPRPRREMPTPMTEWEALAATSTPEERAILSDAEDEEACHELMIWEAGRIHGPEGVDAAVLVLELTLEMLEGGDTPEWWDPEEHTTELAESAMRAAARADVLLRESRAQAAKAQREVLAAPDADPAWFLYDEARAAYPGLLAAWKAVRLEHARKSTGFQSREEHARALYGTTIGDVTAFIRKASAPAK